MSKYYKGQEAWSDPPKSDGEPIFGHQLKIAPETLKEFAVANDVNVSRSQGMTFVDFFMIDPSEAMGLIEGKRTLTKSMVSRVLLGSDTALTLMFSLANSLMTSDTKISIILDGQVMVSNDPELPAVKFE